jgi:hypothetical protein
MEGIGDFTYLQTKHAIGIEDFWLKKSCVRVLNMGESN